MTYATAIQRRLTIPLAVTNKPSYILHVGDGFHLSIIYFQSCPRPKPAKTFHIPQHLARSGDIAGGEEGHDFKYPAVLFQVSPHGRRDIKTPYGCADDDQIVAARVMLDLLDLRPLKYSSTPQQLSVK